MKISLNWLKDYVEIKETPEQIAEMLSNLGFPIENIEQFGNDTALDVEITSNRGDCLSHIGIAREIAAFTGRVVKLPEIKNETVKKDLISLVSVEILNPKLCGRYTARIIEGVKIAPSPAWLVERLQTIGIRSVNNVVDATNYAMVECGQPPHAFDYDKISGKKITIRNAEKNESIVSISSADCKLDTDLLVIADADKPVAIAGVMGGLDTEVSDTTTNILLEEASFDAVAIRTASRRFSLPSEAAYRFERIVDIENIDWASKRCAQLITQLAGGRVVEGIVDIYPAKKSQQSVVMRFSRLNKLLGIDVPKQKATDILAALNFAPQTDGEDKIICSVPSYRSDISREVDLIEEVTRVYGYDKISIKNKINISVVPADKRRKISTAIAARLNSCGFYEAITTSFNNEKDSKLITGKPACKHLAIKDITRKSDNLLRSSLLASLLAVMRHNLNAGNKNIRLYEISDIFSAESDGSHNENTNLSLICNDDLRLLKGAVLQAVNVIVPNAEIQFVPTTKILWAEAGVEAVLNGQKIGTAGIISQKVLTGFNIKADIICAAELSFDLLLNLPACDIKVKAIPKFPAIVRDLSVIADEQIQWQQLIDAIKISAPAELENVDFSGIYRGKPIEKGKKSITLSLRFRDENGTLTHETVDNWQNNIISSLAEKTSATLRKI